MLSVDSDLLVRRLHMRHHIYLAMPLWQTSVTVTSMILHMMSIYIVPKPLEHCRKPFYLVLVDDVVRLEVQGRAPTLTPSPNGRPQSDHHSEM